MNRRAMRLALVAAAVALLLAGCAAPKNETVRVDSTIRCDGVGHADPRRSKCLRGTTNRKWLDYVSSRMDPTVPDPLWSCVLANAVIANYREGYEAL